MPLASSLWSQDDTELLVRLSQENPLLGKPALLLLFNSQASQSRSLMAIVGKLNVLGGELTTSSIAGLQMRLRADLFGVQFDRVLAGAVQRGRLNQSPISQRPTTATDRTSCQKCQQFSRAVRIRLITFKW